MDRNTKRGTVLVVGATGSVGRHVVAEAVHQGYETRALVRDASRAGRLDSAAEKVVGELTRAETLADAVADFDAVVFTHGSSAGSTITMMTSWQSHRCRATPATREAPRTASSPVTR